MSPLYHNFKYLSVITISLLLLCTTLDAKPANPEDSSLKSQSNPGEVNRVLTSKTDDGLWQASARLPTSVDNNSDNKNSRYNLRRDGSLSIVLNETPRDKTLVIRPPLGSLSSIKSPSNSQTMGMGMGWRPLQKIQKDQKNNELRSFSVALSDFEVLGKYGPSDEHVDEYSRAGVSSYRFNSNTIHRMNASWKFNQPAPTPSPQDLLQFLTIFSSADHANQNERLKLIKALSRETLGDENPLKNGQTTDFSFPSQGHHGPLSIHNKDLLTPFTTWSSSSRDIVPELVQNATTTTSASTSTSTNFQELDKNLENHEDSSGIELDSLDPQSIISNGTSRQMLHELIRTLEKLVMGKSYGNISSTVTKLGEIDEKISFGKNGNISATVGEKRMAATDPQQTANDLKRLMSLLLKTGGIHNEPESRDGSEIVNMVITPQGLGSSGSGLGSDDRQKILFLKSPQVKALLDVALSDPSISEAATKIAQALYSEEHFLKNEIKPQAQSLPGGFPLSSNEFLNIHNPNLQFHQALHQMVANGSVPTSIQATSKTNVINIFILNFNKPNDMPGVTSTFQTVQVNDKDHQDHQQVHKEKIKPFISNYHSSSSSQSQSTRRPAIIGSKFPSTSSNSNINPYRPVNFHLNLNKPSPTVIPLRTPAPLLYFNKIHDVDSNDNNNNNADFNPRPTWGWSSSIVEKTSSTSTMAPRTSSTTFKSFFDKRSTTTENPHKNQKPHKVNILDLLPDMNSFTQVDSQSDSDLDLPDEDPDDDLLESSDEYPIANVYITRRPNVTTTSSTSTTPSPLLYSSQIKRKSTPYPSILRKPSDLPTLLFLNKNGANSETLDSYLTNYRPSVETPIPPELSQLSWLFKNEPPPKPFFRTELNNTDKSDGNTDSNMNKPTPVESSYDLDDENLHDDQSAYDSLEGLGSYLDKENLNSQRTPHGEKDEDFIVHKINSTSTSTTTTSTNDTTGTDSNTTDTHDEDDDLEMIMIGDENNYPTPQTYEKIPLSPIDKDKDKDTIDSTTTRYDQDDQEYVLHNYEASYPFYNPMKDRDRDRNQKQMSTMRPSESEETTKNPQQPNKLPQIQQQNVPNANTLNNRVRKLMVALGFTSLPTLAAGFAATYPYWMLTMGRGGRKTRSISSENEEKEFEKEQQEQEVSVVDDLNKMSGQIDHDKVMAQFGQSVHQNEKVSPAKSESSAVVSVVAVEGKEINDDKAWTLSSTSESKSHSNLANASDNSSSTRIISTPTTISSNVDVKKEISNLDQEEEIESTDKSLMPKLNPSFAVLAPVEVDVNVNDSSGKFENRIEMVEKTSTALNPQSFDDEKESFLPTTITGSGNTISNSSSSSIKSNMGNMWTKLELKSSPTLQTVNSEENKTTMMDNNSTTKSIQQNDVPLVKNFLKNALSNEFNLNITSSTNGGSTYTSSSGISSTLMNMNKFASNHQHLLGKTPTKGPNESNLSFQIPLIEINDDKFIAHNDSGSTQIPQHYYHHQALFPTKNLNSNGNSNGGNQSPSILISPPIQLHKKQEQNSQSQIHQSQSHNSHMAPFTINIHHQKQPQKQQQYNGHVTEPSNQFITIGQHHSNFNKFATFSPPGQPLSVHKPPTGFPTTFSNFQFQQNSIKNPNQHKNKNKIQLPSVHQMDPLSRKKLANSILSTMNTYKASALLPLWFPILFTQWQDTSTSTSTNHRIKFNNNKIAMDNKNHFLNHNL